MYIQSLYYCLVYDSHTFISCKFSFSLQTIVLTYKAMFSSHNVAQSPSQWNFRTMNFAFNFPNLYSSISSFGTRLHGIAGNYSIRCSFCCISWPHSVLLYCSFKNSALCHIMEVKCTQKNASIQGLRINLDFRVLWVYTKEKKYINIYGEYIYIFIYNKGEAYLCLKVSLKWILLSLFLLNVYFRLNFCF